MDLNMDLAMDGYAFGYGSGYGSAWGFPAGYRAISWGLSGTRLGPDDDFASGILQLLISVYYAMSWGLSGTCLGLPCWLRCDQVGPVWDLSGAK